MGSNGSELNDVWRSADDGATWQKLCDAAGWSARAGHSMAALPGGSTSCLLLGGLDAAKVQLRDVWRSSNGGATWERLAGQAPWPGRCWSSVAALPGGLVLLLGGSGAEGGQLNDVWRSRDGGASWELLLEAAPWPARQGHGAAALPDGAVLVLGGLAAPGSALNDVWRSADGGASWERIAAAAPWQRRADFGLVARAGGSLLLLGGSGGGGAVGDAWESHDGGAAWSRLVPRVRPAGGSGGGGERPPPPGQERRAPGGGSPPQAPAQGSGPLAPTPDDAASRSLRFEEMPREHLRRAILDLQQGLSDLTQRLDGVAEENSALREENAMLKDAIDERIEGDRPGRRSGPSSAWGAED